MNVWRILYSDAAGEGRFIDLSGYTRDQAVWFACQRVDSPLAELVDVREVDEARMP